MSRENLVEATRRAYEHFNRTGEPLWDLMDPSVRWLNTGDSPSQPRPGVAGAKDWVAGMRRFADEYGFEMDEYLDAGDDRVIAVGRLWAVSKSLGHRLDMPVVHLGTYRRGKLVRLESFRTKADALEAVGPKE